MKYYSLIPHGEMASPTSADYGTVASPKATQGNFGYSEQKEQKKVSLFETIKQSVKA